MRHIRVEATRFNVVLRDELKRAGNRATEFVAETFREAAHRIVDRTPVKTGRAKNNWQAGVGINALMENPPDPGGSYAHVSIDAAVVGFTIGDRLTLSNPVPYIGFLEYGWSDQAPSGMVRITMAELPQIKDEALQKVRAME